MERVDLIIVGVLGLVLAILLMFASIGSQYNSYSINKIKNVSTVESDTLIIDYSNMYNEEYSKVCFVLNQTQICFNESGKV